MALSNWQDCLRVTFTDLQPQVQGRVLIAWLDAVGEDVGFADFVLFYLVRPLLFQPDVKEAWIRRGIQLALTTLDESLVETLVWTLGKGVRDHPPLFEAVQKHSSPKIRHAAQEVGVG
jgi:hypothetical protein